MHLFSILALLLMGHVTTTAGQRFYYTEGEHVCPGYSFQITQLHIYESLYFKSSTPGSSKKQVANRTHIFLPSYVFKNHYIFIPEVMKQHEGLYTRDYLSMPQLSFPVVKLVLKDCSVRSEVPYGETFSLVVPEEASILEFTTSKSTARRVLWSRINTDNQRGARGTVTRGRWEAAKMTKADEGRYTLLKENGAEVSSTRLNVTELSEQYDWTREDIERMKFPVPFAEAVLTFIDSSKNKHVLFQNAMVTDKAFLLFGSRIDLRAEYGELVLTVKDLKSGDKGQYEVHDKNKDRAVVLYVYDSSESSNKNPSKHGSPINVRKLFSIITPLMLLSAFFCWLMSCLFSDSPAPVQPVHVHDPVAMPTPVDSAPHRPVTMESADHRPWLQPNAALTHYRDSQPPPYPEVAGSSSEPCYRPAGPWASVGGSGGAAGAGAGADTNPSAPSAPLDPGPQYQFRGWGGGPGDFFPSSALSMDTSTDTSAYNSDNLNF